MSARRSGSRPRSPGIFYLSNPAMGKPRTMLRGRKGVGGTTWAVVLARNAVGYWPTDVSPRYDVHHVNGDSTDESPGNLVVCGRGYHRYLEGWTHRFNGRLPYPVDVDAVKRHGWDWWWKNTDRRTIP